MFKKANLVTLLMVLFGLSLLAISRLGPNGNQISPLNSPGPQIFSGEAIDTFAPDFELPEFPMGSIIGLVAFMLAFMVYAAQKKSSSTHFEFFFDK